jgi:predicted ABC-type ATPase
MGARARQPDIYVLAGVNGAGKSSIGGAAIRSAGADYYNPDETATALQRKYLNWSRTEANATAWRQGKRLLEKAIAQRLDFAFETTLGGNSMVALLNQAATSGIAVHVWYVGLATPELHIERVQARVLKGGHDIAEADIRRRYRTSRLNLIHLLPKLGALRVYDNSAEADPNTGTSPKQRLLLHLRKGKILGPRNLAHTPEWAKPIVAAALKLRSD